MVAVGAGLVGIIDALLSQSKEFGVSISIGGQHGGTPRPVRVARGMDAVVAVAAAGGAEWALSMDGIAAPWGLM